MEDFLIRGAGVLFALTIVGRVCVQPLVRLARHVLDELAEIKAAVDELPKLDEGLAELAKVRDQINAGLRGMQSIIASQEDRVALVEAELAELQRWRHAVDELTDDLLGRVEHIERRSSA